MENSSFYINNIHIIQSENDIDLSGIPLNYKRRLSKQDKVVLSLLFKSFNNDAEEIVYSSTFGEFERLKTIIEQYRTFNEVSPMQFSGSVHNFPAGNFCLIKNTAVPYHAISSNNNSVSAGIIKSVISQKRKILFCYADYTEEAKGISFTVLKERNESSDIECKILRSNSDKQTDEFNEICRFVNGEITVFETSLCNIRRLS